MRSTLYRVFPIVALLVLGLMGLNCASIIHGTKQRVSISSTPNQAKVEITTSGGVPVFAGNTPASVPLKRKQEYKVNISLDGYKTQTVMIDKEFDSWTIGNLLCGGILGIIIDATNGAMYKLEPEMIQVELIQASVDGRDTEIYAVFRAMNSEGELQTLVVPMIGE